MITLEERTTINKLGFFSWALSPLLSHTLFWVLIACDYSRSWTLPSYCSPSDYVGSRKSHKCTAYMLCIPFVRFLLFPFHLQKSHNFYHITLRAKWWKMYMGLPVYLSIKRVITTQSISWPSNCAQSMNIDQLFQSSHIIKVLNKPSCLWPLNLH